MKQSKYVLITVAADFGKILLIMFVNIAMYNAVDVMDHPTPLA